MFLFFPIIMCVCIFSSITAVEEPKDHFDCECIKWDQCSWSNDVVLRAVDLSRESVEFEEIKQKFGKQNCGEPSEHRVYCCSSDQGSQDETQVFKSVTTAATTSTTTTTTTTATTTTTSKTATTTSTTTTRTTATTSTTTTTATTATTIIISTDKEPTVCGQNKNQRRAASSFAFSNGNGNIDTTIGKYPWTVAILYVKGRAQKLHCGGSLISTKHILTASHCFTGKTKEDLIVIVGSEDSFSFDITKQGQEFKIKDFVRHPNYTQYKVYFDVAIIEMDKPVTFSFTIHPICLPKVPNTDIDSVQNIPATLSGYGSKSGETSTVIHYSPLTIMRQKECEELMFDLKTSNSEFGQDLWRKAESILDSERKISNELICTKAPIEELGTCPGDSGSSLIMEDPDSKRQVQIGIVYGSLEQCNDQKYPSLYARLDDYNILSFIRETAFGDKIEPVGVQGVNLIVTFTFVVDDLKKARPRMEGLYIHAPKSINGKPYWFQEDDVNNIWYSKEGYWCIGRIQNLVGVSCGIASTRNDAAEPQQVVRATHLKIFGTKILELFRIFPVQTLEFKHMIYLSIA